MTTPSLPCGCIGATCDDCRVATCKSPVTVPDLLGAGGVPTQTLENPTALRRQTTFVPMTQPIDVLSSDEESKHEERSGGGVVPETPDRVIIYLCSSDCWNSVIVAYMFFSVVGFPIAALTAILTVIECDTYVSSAQEAQNT